jgi:hypothetical protein
MVAPRTFDALRGAHSDEHTTLAYWLGSYGGKLDVEEILGVGSAMGLQYDFEEQADAYGAALPEDGGWTKVFAPVAPVQLAAEWSPLTRAVDVLGEPTVEAVGPSVVGIRMVVAGWDAAKASDVKTTARPSTSADDKRFLGLLTVSVTRAQQTRRGLLIVAKPGWDHERVHAISKATARLMGKAGFVVTTRRP